MKNLKSKCRIPDMKKINARKIMTKTSIGLILLRDEGGGVGTTCPLIAVPEGICNEGGIALGETNLPSF